MPRKRNVYHCPEFDVEMHQKSVKSDAQAVSEPQNSANYDLHESLDEKLNHKLFNLLVLQTIISKLPKSMPSFDRVNVIEKLKTELKEFDIESNLIPWHIVLIEQSKIDTYIQSL